MGFLINSYRYTPVSNGLLNNLVSYYKADTSGSFTDAHGSNNGTINGATYTSSGKINGAYDFDGSNDYVNTNYAIPITSAWSLSIWFKADAFSGNNTLFAQQDGTGTGRTILLREATSGFSSNIGGSLQSTSTSLSTGVWYHGVITYDSGTIKHYLNGSLLGTFSQTAESATGDLIIGAHKSTTQDFWNGILDEIGIWSSAITQDKVTSLYNSGTGLSYDSFTT